MRSYFKLKKFQSKYKLLKQNTNASSIHLKKEYCIAKIVIFLMKNISYHRKTKKCIIKKMLYSSKQNQNNH